MAENTLTEQQKKWMASVRASLENVTGRSLADWIALAGQCPETRPKARQKWFKDHHGLRQNYFMLVERERGLAAGADPRSPVEAEAALWSDPESAAIFHAVKVAVGDLPDLITGQRKTYTTWSRSFAFACARPVKGGSVRLGLAVEPGASGRLAPAAKEGWSERLKATLVLATPDAVDDEVRTLLRTAWARS